VFNGRDEGLAAGLLMGADGGIGSSYNVAPELFVAICTAAAEGRWEDARTAQRRANTLIPGPAAEAYNPAQGRTP
jgi:N-acetylneuraminate lyase